MKKLLFLCAALAAVCRPSLAQEPPNEPPQEPKAPSKEQIEATWKTACEWGVGSAAERVRAARKKMVEYGPPGLAHVLTRLASSDGLELESVQAVVDGFGAAAAIPLLDALEGETGELALREGLHLLGVLNGKKCVEGEAQDRACGFILECTRSESMGVKLRALLIASDFGLRGAIPAAVALANHEKEGVRRGVAQILGKFGGQEVVAPLIGMLRDPLMTVRFPAQYSLAQCKAAAVPELIEAIGTEKDGIARNHLLMALGATGADEGLSKISEFLKADDPLARGFAVRALTNHLEARRSAWSSSSDDAAKADGLDRLKERASMLRAAVGVDPHHFVKAQIDELGRIVEAIDKLAPPEEEKEGDK